MNYKLSLCALTTAILVSSCSKDKAVAPGAAAATPSSAISASTVLINSEVEKFGQLSPGSAFNQNAFTIASWWDDATTSQLCDDRSENCSRKVSGRDYFSVQLDPDAVRESNGSSINVFGRLKQGLGVICALGEAVGASNFEGNYIKDGAYKVTFTAAMSSRISSICGMEDDLAGETISMTVTTNADTSVLNKKVVLCWENTDTCSIGSAEYFETFMYKSDDTATNIATIEDSEPDDPSAPEYYSRLLVKMDKVADTLAVEYLSAEKTTGEPSAQGGVEVLRLYKDGNIGLMLSSQNRHGAIDQAFMVGGDVSTTSSDVEINFVSQSPVLSDKGSFSRTTGALSVGPVDAGLDFTDNATIQNALYGGLSYDYTDFYGLKETSAPSFTSLGTVRTAPVAVTTH